MCMFFFYENIALILHLKYTIQLLFQLKIKENSPKAPAKGRYPAIADVALCVARKTILWSLGLFSISCSGRLTGRVVGGAAFLICSLTLCPRVEKYSLPSLPPVLIWQCKPSNFMFSCPFIHNSLSLGKKKKSIFVHKSFLLGAGSEEWKGLRNIVSVYRSSYKAANLLGPQRGWDD